MRIIEYSLLLHISVFDLDHKSERIPKETVCCIPVMVTLFQVTKKKGVFKLYQLMGNFFFFESTWKSRETEETIKRYSGFNEEQERHSAYNGDPEV